MILAQLVRDAVSHVHQARPLVTSAIHRTTRELSEWWLRNRRWIYLDTKNLVVLPVLIGFSYGCGQFLGQRWLSTHIGHLISWVHKTTLAHLEYGTLL